MLKIKSSGYVKSGQFDFIYSPDLQVARVMGQARIGIGGPVVKTVKFDESETIEKDLMKSAAFYQGRKEKFDDMDIEVVSNQDTYAIVVFKNEKGDDGFAEVDLTKEYISFIRISINIKYFGRKLKVEAALI